MEAPPGGVWICVQPNGERLRVEHWVYEAWRYGTLRDPELLRILCSAVRIEDAMFGLTYEYASEAGRLLRKHGA